MLPWGQRSVPGVISLDMDDVAESVDVSNFFGDFCPFCKQYLQFFPFVNHRIV